MQEGNKPGERSAGKEAGTGASISRKWASEVPTRDTLLDQVHHPSAGSSFQQPLTHERGPSLPRYIRETGRSSSWASAADGFHERQHSYNPAADREQAGRVEASSSSSPRETYITGIPRTRSPELLRQSSSASGKHWLTQVPEDAEMAENVGSTTPGRLELGSRSFYGSTSNNGSVIDEDSELSEEEEEWLLDEELAKDGLYRGNYKSLVWLFTFVPLTSILAFVLLSVVPMFFWRRLPPSAFPYPPYLPFPLPEVLVSTALWSLSFLLRDVIFTVSQAFTSIFPFSARLPSLLPVLTSILAAILQSATSLILRQLAVPVLLVPLYSTGRIVHPSDDVHKGHFPTWQDGAFRRVWWIALGWAAAEAVVAIKQGYESIALYKEVLVDPQHVPKKSSLMSPVNQTSRTPRSPANGGSPRLPHEEGEDTALTPTQHTVSSPPWQRRASNSGIHEDLQASTTLGERQPLLTLGSRASNDPLVLHQTNESQRALVEDEVEQDLDELLKFKTREELEEVYGIPFIHIPVFLLCLHRVNSILGSLSATLILSAAYMRSPLAYSAILPTFASSNVLSSLSSDKLPPTPSSNRFLFVSFFTLLFIQTLLSLTHTPWILPRIGVHTFVYVGLLVWLGVFFVALGVWEVLT